MLGRRLADVGLGHVGLPAAIAFGRRASPVSPAIGHDIKPLCICELKAGIDKTGKALTDKFASNHVRCSGERNEKRMRDLYLAAVPSPVDSANRPDLSLLLLASRTAGSVLNQHPSVWQRPPR